VIRTKLEQKSQKSVDFTAFFSKKKRKKVKKAVANAWKVWYIVQVR